MRIDSPDHSHYAILTDDHTGGVRVNIWRETSSSGRLRKKIDNWVIDCCWHIACDRVFDIMQNVRDQ